MRVIRRIVVGVAALVLLAVLGLAVAYRDPLRTVASIRRVDSYPLFVMRLYGDGGMEGRLRWLRGAADSASSPEGVPAWACTCFSARTPDGGRLFGRNFDWHNRPALVLFSDPPDGHASVTISDVSYLLPRASRYIGEGAQPLTLADRIRLIAAVEMPFDGMNERGLAVGIMAVPTAPAPRDPALPTLGSLQVMRLMLDRAATVEEALALLRRVNVSFSGGPQVHYLLADSAGDTALVEYTREGMLVVGSPEPWQVSTNFAFTGDTVPAADSPCWRYNAVYAALQASSGAVSSEEAMDLLGQCSQESTRWSAVYDQAGGEVSIAMGRNYERVHRFRLPMAADGGGAAE